MRRVSEIRREALLEIISGKLVELYVVIYNNTTVLILVGILIAYGVIATPVVSVKFKLGYDGQSLKASWPSIPNQSRAKKLNILHSSESSPEDQE